MNNKLCLKLNFGTKFSVKNHMFTITGPLGDVTFTNSKICTTNNNPNKQLLHTNLQYIFNGFWRGFLICLFIEGVGYRVQVKDNNLSFNIGFVDNKELCIPANINIFIDQKETSLFLFSSDFTNLMQFTTKILNLKKINIYKGTGIYKIGSMFKPKHILKK